MSTLSPRSVATEPILVDGQRLDQPEFHRLYELTPEQFKAELIDGVVYVACPVGLGHGGAHVPVNVWLAYYEENTPGVESYDNATAIIGPRSELQPDASIRISPASGGRTRNVKGIIAGPPELVVEVAHSSRYVDLGPKLADYERAGVLEYVVRTCEPDEVRWHALRDGRFVALPPDPDGIHRSAAFPGLWLDPAALLGRDFRRLRAVIDRGVATPAHAEFVARLATPPA